MQDRICRIDENLLHRTAGPYMWVIIDRLCGFRRPCDVCSSPEAICLLRRNEMTRMGWTGRAPAPNGSQGAWGACQEEEYRHASHVHRSRSHHHRN